MNRYISALAASCCACFMATGAAGAGRPIVPPLNGAVAGKWQYFTLGDGFLYDVLLPYGYSTNYTYPVVVYLHGVGTQMPAGTPPGNAFPVMMNSTNVQGVNFRAYYPAIVVAPQCARSAFGSNDWGGTRTSLQNHVLVNPTMPCGRDAISAVRSVMAKFAANPKKIYLTGYSMGGFGAYYRYATNLDLFAAAVAVSGSIYGGVTAAQMETIMLRAPFWAFHGFNDYTVPKTWDEQTYLSSRSRAGIMKYIEFVVAGDKTSFPAWLETYDGDGHAYADISAFQNPATLNWLFAQSK